MRFLYTFAWVFGTSAIVGISCLPPWPMWNRPKRAIEQPSIEMARHPVKWLEPQDDEDEEPKAKKVQESHANRCSNATKMRKTMKRG